MAKLSRRKITIAFVLAFVFIILLPTLLSKRWIKTTTQYFKIGMPLDVFQQTLKDHELIEGDSVVRWDKLKFEGKEPYDGPPCYLIHNRWLQYQLIPVPNYDKEQVVVSFDESAKIRYIGPSSDSIVKWGCPGIYSSRGDE